MNFLNLRKNVKQPRWHTFGTVGLRLLATLRKPGHQVRRKGRAAITRSFNSTREALVWAREQELEADTGRLQLHKKLKDITVAHIVSRYSGVRYTMPLNCKYLLPVNNRLGGLWTMAILPKLHSNLHRIDLEIVPPSLFVSNSMNFSVMSAAERHSEFITNLETDCPRLRKAQMMRIGWLPAAHQTRLRSDEF